VPDALAVVEIPTEPQLKYNEHGGIIVRQSDLSSWQRCQLQKFYYAQAAADPDAPQPRQLSATVYGSVIHYALLIMEQLHHEGRQDACEVAVATFEHYWNPENIDQLDGISKVTQWLPRQTYGGLRERGRRVLRDYYRLLIKDDAHLLALEYQFAVPISVSGRIHTLTGTVDKLEVRRKYGKPFIDIRDFKTGRQPTYLRYNQQGSAYAYATTRYEFWEGWAESGMGELPAFERDTVAMLEKLFESYGFRLHTHHELDAEWAARRFTWVNMHELKHVDGGWRNERDFARLKLAIDAYVRANEAGIYSPNVTGDVCFFCPFKTTCGGLALPDEDYGALRP
jgi:hypothetical protein